MYDTFIRVTQESTAKEEVLHYKLCQSQTDNYTASYDIFQPIVKASVSIQYTV